jgi:hypothetical protein
MALARNWLFTAGGLQNIAWPGFYYCALRFELESAKAAALALWGTLLLAPGVVHEIVTAGDLLATSLYAAVGLSVLVLVAKRRVAGHGLPFGVGLLVGMSLSSRLIYLLLMPLVCWRSCACEACVTGRSRSSRSVWVSWR